MLAAVLFDAFGLVYDATGSVVAATLCHALYNAVQFVVTWIGTPL